MRPSGASEQGVEAGPGTSPDAGTARDGHPERIPELVPEFEAYLASRTAGREDVGRYLRFSPARIQHEADSITRTLGRFAVAVAAAIESPRTAHDFLRSLDLRVVSRDHNWRRIFAELTDRDPCYDGHRRTLLVRYLQFLGDRKRLLEYVQARQAGLEETSQHVLAPVPGDDTPRLIAPGETVMRGLTEGRVLRLRLGRRRFELVAEERPVLLGPLDGADVERHVLRLGRNLIGRHPESDVVLDPAMRDVSRVHVLIDCNRAEDEADGPGTFVVRVTNLSGAHTYLSGPD